MATKIFLENIATSIWQFCDTKIFSNEKILCRHLTKGLSEMVGYLIILIK